MGRLTRYELFKKNRHPLRTCGSAVTSHSVFFSITVNWAVFFFRRFKLSLRNM